MFVKLVDKHSFFKCETGRDFHPTFTAPEATTYASTSFYFKLLSHEFKTAQDIPPSPQMYLIEACALLLIAGLKLAALVLAVVGVTRYQ